MLASGIVLPSFCGTIYFEMTIQELQKAIQPLMRYELFTVRQLAFLLKLQQAGGNTEAGAIRKSLGIGRPATSRALDSLGQKHLITRMRSAKDRRFCNVKLQMKAALSSSSFAGAHDTQIPISIEGQRQSRRPALP